MSFDSDSIFPYRLVVASVLAALGSGLLGGVGVWLKVMTYPAWEMALLAGFISGLLAAILGVAAGVQAAWRYFRPEAGLDEDEGTSSSSRVLSALITATVAVAGGSGLLALAGEFLKIAKAPYWELLLQLAALGMVLALLLGIGAGGRALWQYGWRRASDTVETG